MTSPRVKKIFQTHQKMGPMSESIREHYREIIYEMIDNLTEEELEELSKSPLSGYIKEISQSTAASYYDKRTDKDNLKRGEKKKGSKVQQKNLYRGAARGDTSDEDN